MRFPDVSARCAAALFVGLFAAAGDVRADFASHRAMYTLSLVRMATGSGITEIDGQMEYTVVETCDGWNTEQRTVMRFVGSAGYESLVGTHYRSWESKDGRRIRFEANTVRDNEITEEISGDASVGADGGVVRYTKPDIMPRPLPAGTVFPTRHAEQVVATARAGDNQAMSVVFDGSTLDGPYAVSVLMFPVEEGREIPGLARTLEVWNARFTYFPVGGQVSKPEFEIGLILRGDGIFSEIELDHEDFVVKGTLDNIEMLAPEGC